MHPETPTRSTRLLSTRGSAFDWLSLPRGNLHYRKNRRGSPPASHELSRAYVFMISCVDEEIFCKTSFTSTEKPLPKAIGTDAGDGSNSPTIAFATAIAWESAATDHGKISTWDKCHKCPSHAAIKRQARVGATSMIGALRWKSNCERWVHFAKVVIVQNSCMFKSYLSYSTYT